MAHDELLLHFESLGDDCEFGLVQRFAGHDPLGLLRFAFIPMAGLIDLLDHGMDRIGEPDDTFLVRDERDEIVVQLPSFGVRYHTHIHGRQGHEQAILADQLRRIPFLRRKLQEDLAEGHKIFVRKGQGSDSLPAMQHLLALLRRHGPVTLLWVTLAEGSQPVGTVEVVQEGLLRGTIDRFATFFGQADINMPAWLEICRGARLLQLIQAPPGTVRPPPVPVLAGNLLRQTLRFEGDWWRREAVSSSTPDASMTAPAEGSVVMAHTLTNATDWPTAAIFGRYVPQGLSAGSLYVASLDVWIPDDCDASMVGMVFDGFASTRTVNADPERRCQWQRIWVQARVPEGMSAANPSLCLLGPAGTTVFTACWKLEQGVVPTPYPVQQDDELANA